MISAASPSLANPKTSKKTTTNPTKNITINIWQIGTFKRPSSAHVWCEDACVIWLHSSTILGSAGLGEAFGHHGWIVFCVHLSYLNVN